MDKTTEEFVEYRGTKDDQTEQDILYQAYAAKGPEWHQRMTRKVLRKVDWHLLPFLVLMYLLNSLDRKCATSFLIGICSG